MLDRLIRISSFRFAALVVSGVISGGVFGFSRSASAAGESTVRLFGIDYVNAVDFARRLGLTAIVTKTAEGLRLQSAWTTIDLAVHSVEVTLNGTRIFLAEPFAMHRGAFYLSLGDAENILRPILAPPAVRTPPALRTIVIDAGHGGSDPGNQNMRLRLDEKTYTLDVARRLERLLKQQGYKVVMTRTRDRAVELEDRPERANQVRADLFISIHFNGFIRPGVAGTETYVMTPRGQRSSPQREQDGAMADMAYPGNRHDRCNVVLGYQVHRQLVGRLNSLDRGLKHFRYSVLRAVDCPAVLVEAAFLSNDAEGRKVATAAYRQKIAEGIAAGVKEYAGTLDRLGAAGN